MSSSRKLKIFENLKFFVKTKNRKLDLRNPNKAVQNLTALFGLPNKAVILSPFFFFGVSVIALLSVLVKANHNVKSPRQVA